MSKSFKTALLGNSYSYEASKFSARSDSVPLFMTQLQQQKADLNKETTGFSYQTLDIYRNTEKLTRV